MASFSARVQVSTAARGPQQLGWEPPCHPALRQACMQAPGQTPPIAPTRDTPSRIHGAGPTCAGDRDSQFSKAEGIASKESLGRQPGAPALCFCLKNSRPHTGFPERVQAQLGAWRPRPAPSGRAGWAPRAPGTWPMVAA